MSFIITVPVIQVSTVVMEKDNNGEDEEEEEEISAKFAIKLERGDQLASTRSTDN